MQSFDPSGSTGDYRRTVDEQESARAVTGGSGSGTPAHGPARSPEELAGRLAALGIDVPALTWHGDLAIGVPVADFACPAGEAIGWWRRLHAVAGRTGHQPVLVDQDRTVLFATPVLEELTWEPLGPAQRLARSAALDPVAVLNPKGTTLDTVDPDEVERWLEEWPDDPRRIDRLPLPDDCGQDGPVIVALVPAAYNWQIPVLLSYGYFNGCPHPSVHGAVLRHWNRRYGLDVVSMTHAAMGFAVSRPPRTRRAALEFAWEYAGYCLDGFDVVYEAEDMGGMAACLIDAEVMHAWWD